MDENVKDEVVVTPLTPKEENDKEIANLTDKMLKAMNGRKESEIGLEDGYWEIRNQLQRAYDKSKEL